jgi:hypothetical protein
MPLAGRLRAVFASGMTEKHEPRIGARLYHDRHPTRIIVRHGRVASGRLRLGRVDMLEGGALAERFCSARAGGMERCASLSRAAVRHSGARAAGRRLACPRRSSTPGRNSRSRASAEGVAAGRSGPRRAAGDWRSMIPTASG